MSHQVKNIFSCVFSSVFTVSCFIVVLNSPLVASCPCVFPATVSVCPALMYTCVQSSPLPCVYRVLPISPKLFPRFPHLCLLLQLVPPTAIFRLNASGNYVINESHAQE